MGRTAKRVRLAGRVKVGKADIADKAVIVEQKAIKEIQVTKD